MDGIIMTMIGNVCERARSQKPDEHLAQAQAHERRLATFVTRIWHTTTKLSLSTTGFQDFGERFRPGSRQRLQPRSL